jgi:hypothetical protein
MASGLCAALTGRTHGCTDQPANVKKTLANSEPSTHGTKRRCATVQTFGNYRENSGHSAGLGGRSSDENDPSGRSQPRTIGRCSGRSPAVPIAGPL